MKKSKLALTSIAMTICGVFILMPNAKADTTITKACGATTDALQNYINSANAGQGGADCVSPSSDLVTLSHDVTIPDTTFFSGSASITLDLNGHNVTFSNPITINSALYTFTIKNSGTISTNIGNKHGNIYLNSITNNYGHFKLNNVRVEGTNNDAILVVSGGIVDIVNNAKIYNTSSIGNAIVSHGGSLTISDSTIYAGATNERPALKVDDTTRISTTTITNSDFSTRSNGYGIQLNEDSTNKGSTFTFNSGTTEGLSITPQSTTQFSVVINGGTFDNGTYYGLLIGNNAHVTLNGGTFKGEKAAIGTSYSSKSSFIGTGKYLTGSLESNYPMSPSYKLSLKEATVVPAHSTTTLEKSSYTYTGKVITPSVIAKDVLGNNLVKDKDYTITCTSGCKNVGNHTSTVSYIGNYAGYPEQSFTFKIVKANNPMKVTVKNQTVKYKKVKKKKQTVKAITVTNNQGALVFTKTSGKKNFTVNKSNGKITVKKKTKKGTYKIKVQVTAKGNANYNSMNKTVTVKIKVK